MTTRFSRHSREKGSCRDSIVPDPVAPTSPRAPRATLTAWLLLTPMTAWLILFVVLPTAILLIYSFATNAGSAPAGRKMP